jgi:hypothetical protein
MNRQGAKNAKEFPIKEFPIKEFPIKEFPIKEFGPGTANSGLTG